GKITSIKSERMKFVLTDWITANISFMLFNVFRYFDSEYDTFSFESLFRFLGLTKLCIEQAIVPLFMLFIYWLSGFYNRPFGKSRFSELLNTAIVSAIITIIIHLALLTNDQMSEVTANIVRIILVFIIFFFFTLLGRLIVINSQIHHFKNRDWKYSAVIVGNSERAHMLAKSLKESKAVISYSVEGFFSIPGESEHDSDAWNLNNIEEICREYSINQIILVPQKSDEENILRLLYQLFPLGIPIKLSPDMLSFMTSSIKLKDIYGQPLVDLTHSSMSESEKNIKRTMDVVLSIITLLVLSPLFLILAIWVKLDSRGPIFYSQKRIGLKEKPFDIIKFRTMHPDAENNGPQLSNDNDPRVTKAGRFMRKYRLDELPQFWNVLRGDMSIVGPRPEREFFSKQIVKIAPYYAWLYQTRPGITSWGMVQYGYASSIDQMVERSKYDLIYMSNMSILVDLKIMLYTVLTILDGRGK
ncbi:MAG: sugar transferase, partial [Muribaculaceae bacterium]|nr:sugar transferase [Muribaculaceae bacterium]